MWTFIKITTWVFFICFLIVGVAHWIPAERTGPSAIERGPIGESPEELVKAGKAVFFGPDACHVCHALDPGVPNKRCPINMKEVFLRASSRAEEIKKSRDPEMTPIKYLVESVYNPNAYIVQDKKLGGPFVKNLMKPINGPPLALSDQQIKAVLTFLISKSGTTVDAKMIRGIEVAQAPYKGKEAVVAGGEEFKVPEGDPEMGKDVFAEMKCWQCHLVRGGNFGETQPGKVGPELTNIGGIQTLQYLMESIVNPSAVVVPGKGYSGPDGESKMPEFHDIMTLRQLVDLIAYMKTLKGNDREKPKDKNLSASSQ
ncbi:MAG: c-type cytochrome [Candidatus Binatia bacterium]